MAELSHPGDRIRQAIMSTMHLSPYVNFQGRAREALEHYQRVLGGTLDLGNAGPDDRIANARLEADGVVIIGTDGHPTYPPTVGDNLALAVGGADRDVVARVFDGLAEGGTVKMPLTQQPGGGEVGYLADRFGINWVVNVDPA
jgi:PhnB protein